MWQLWHTHESFSKFVPLRSGKLSRLSNSPPPHPLLAESLQDSWHLSPLLAKKESRKMRHKAPKSHFAQSQEGKGRVSHFMAGQICCWIFLKRCCPCGGGGRSPEDKKASARRTSANLQQPDGTNSMSMRPSITRTRETFVFSERIQRDLGHPMCKSSWCRAYIMMDEPSGKGLYQIIYFKFQVYSTLFRY